MVSVLQWNCRGFRSNFEELKLLIREYDPACICLQELILGVNYPFLLPPISVISYTSHHRGNNDRGGAGLLVRNSFHSDAILLQTQLHAVAARVIFSRPYSLCSLYLPPSEAVSYEDLEDLIKQLEPHFIFVGDFNIRHPMWGDTSTSPNANIVIDLIAKHNLVCMNSGAPTHYHQASQSFTHIDISLCSNIISQSLMWSSLDDLYSRDHYPIIIALMGTDSSLDSPSRWCFWRADWALFRDAAKIFQSLISFPSIDKALGYFMDVVMK